MDPNAEKYPWYALQVRTGHERKVATRLDGKCFERFLPLCSSKRRWSDRVKEIETPLFPGYMFCRLDILRRLPILTTPGVVRIVSLGGVPQPVDEAEVMAIQVLVGSSLPTHPWPFLEIGTRARIHSGPLAGVEGILLEIKGRRRLVLSVTLLQRSVAVEVDAAQVTAATDGAALSFPPHTAGPTPLALPGM